MSALAKKSPKSNVAVVNYSGISEKAEYKAGGGGRSSYTGLVHYKVEVAPGTSVAVVGDLSKMSALDMNGQLWLCLQDMAHQNFTSKLSRNNSEVETATKIIRTVYETEMVIVTDDDWDYNGDRLLTVQGQKATMDSIRALVHANYNHVSMIIVREKDSTYNDDKINGLCKGAGSYIKANSNTMDVDFDKATARVLA